jgi:hypothetical protein
MLTYAGRARTIIEPASSICVPVLLIGNTDGFSLRPLNLNVNALERAASASTRASSASSSASSYAAPSASPSASASDEPRDALATPSLETQEGEGAAVARLAALEARAEGGGAGGRTKHPGYRWVTGVTGVCGRMRTYADVC